MAVAVYCGEEAVIVRERGHIVESENKFVRRTQGHVDKYHLKIDSQRRNFRGIQLFNFKIR